MEDNEEELSAGRPLKSLHTRIVSPVKFVNHTGRRVNLKWFDYDGQEVPFATLEGNNRLVVNTYVTHPWIAVDDQTNERMLLNFRKIYFPDEPDIRRVDYEGRRFYAVRTQINITTPGNFASISGYPWVGQRESDCKKGVCKLDNFLRRWANSTSKGRWHGSSFPLHLCHILRFFFF